MLSYQHLYHAGNLADVQKHSLLCWMLSYLTRKDKPLSYFETHAGRGLYDLGSNEALKTGEAAQGIGRVLGSWFNADHPYRIVTDRIRSVYGATAYAGSPVLAAELLRKQDRTTLCELHPQEVVALRIAMKGRGARILQKDGLQVAQSWCPPTPRRGLLLIDPSYEVKSEYEAMARALPSLHRKWNVGVIALWYPILSTAMHKPMITSLRQAIPDAVCHEVRFPPVREGHKMIGSGMFVINAPYGIEEETNRLSKLFARL